MNASIQKLLLDLEAGVFEQKIDRALADVAGAQRLTFYNADGAAVDAAAAAAIFRQITVETLASATSKIEAHHERRTALESVIEAVQNHFSNDLRNVLGDSCAVYFGGFER